MSITDWPLQERPRERLLETGVAALSDAELLAIFLRTGVKGKTAVDLARDLLNEFGGLRDLLEAPLRDFCKLKGVGTAKYALLQAVLEIGRRYLKETLRRTDTMTDTQQTKQYCTLQLRHQQREVFACLFLDTRYRVLTFEEMFHGTINRATVYPREIVKRALDLNAAAIIFAHNHPSGVAEPSFADQQLTQQLKAMLTAVGIEVVDHMVVGDGHVTSFAELGLL